jgi:hypothetical protein
MLTGSDTVEPFDVNTFQYVYDSKTNYITFTKKIFDAPHVLTYTSLSTLKMEPSNTNPRLTPFNNNQIFRLRDNPSSLNDLLSTSNYVYTKSLDNRELNVDLDESVYSFNTNFLFNSEYYYIDPYKSNNFYVNILNLKNQKTVKNTQSQGGVFLNQPSFKHRYYENLYTGVNQVKGNYNIGLGFSSYTLTKKLLKDNLNYFHIPYDIYPFEKLNINDSSLVNSGAISSNTPYYSDKIFKKLSDYKYSSNFGDVTDTQTGSYLCSWLSGGADINDKGTWVDRYYNPNKIGYFDAIQNPSTGLTNFEYIDNATQNDNIAYDIYDVKSSLTFEKGALYAYHHIGNNNCQAFVNNLSGNLIVNNLTQYFTLTYDQQIYQNEIVFNHNYFTYVLDKPLDELSEFDNFSVSFDLSNENWNEIFGSQIIGNYSQKGFGIFNYRKITPYSLSFNDNKILIFNTQGLIMRTIVHEAYIISVQKFEPNGTFLVIDENKNIFKYNYIGGVLESSTINCDFKSNYNFYTYNLDLYILSNNKWYAINSDSLKIVEKDFKEVRIGNSIKSIVVRDNIVYLLPGTNPKIYNNLIYFVEGDFLKYFDINNVDLIKNKVEAEVIDYVFDNQENLFLLYNNSKFAVINNLDFLVYNDELSTVTGFEESFGKSIDLIDEFYETSHSDNNVSVVSLSGSESLARLCYSRFSTDLSNNRNIVTNYFVNSVADSFNYNYNINNYDYLNNNLEYKNSLDCVIKLPKIYDTQTYEYATLSYPLSNLSPGYHNFTITFDTLNGLFNFYVDGVNVDTYEFEKGSYSFGTIFDNKFYIGTEPSYGNNKLNENLNNTNYYNYGDFKLKNFYMYNIPLDIYEIANIIRTKYDINDIQFELPTGKRNYVENIDKFFMNKLPGRKSNLFNIRINDSSITEPEIKANIDSEIYSKIEKVLPASTKLNKIIWEKI